MIVSAVVLDRAVVDDVAADATRCCGVAHLQCACRHLRAASVGECPTDLRFTRAVLNHQACTADVVRQRKGAGCAQQQNACVCNVS